MSQRLASSRGQTTQHLVLKTTQLNTSRRTECETRNGETWKKLSTVESMELLHIIRLRSSVTLIKIRTNEPAPLHETINSLQSLNKNGKRNGKKRIIFVWSSGYVVAPFDCSSYFHEIMTRRNCWRYGAICVTQIFKLFLKQKKELTPIQKTKN